MSEKPEKIKKATPDIVALDLGTGNLVCAKKADDKVMINSLRNAYLEIPTEYVKSNQISETDLDYLILKDENDKEKIYVISEDAFKMSTIFGSNLKRPMAKGLISQSDMDAPEIIMHMLKSLIKKVPPNGTIIYSIPATPIDNDELASNQYHTRLFKKIFKTIGFEVAEPLNEGRCVIFSECADSKFSGIGISHGSGQTNFNLSWKGVSINEFSTTRGGDYIDNEVAKTTGLTIPRVTNIKENLLSLENKSSLNKIEKRTVESLEFYYEDFIEYNIEMMVKHLTEISDGLNIDEAIPIVLSGGTSLPVWFLDKFKEIFKPYEKEFPYKISEIRLAKDQLNAVARGALVYGYWLNKNTKE